NMMVKQQIMDTMKKRPSFRNLIKIRPAACSLMFLGVSFLILSCEDVLVEEPRTVTEENFYNTPEEVATAVNAIYSPLRSENQQTYIATLECHTDYGYGRGSFAQLNDFQGMNSNNANRVAGFWNAFYLSIRNANLVIANGPIGNSVSQEEIDEYVAEAKFMRAWNYFNLVRNWAAVPLRTEANMEDLGLEKSAEADIYALIVEDLQQAELALPEA